MFGDRRGFMPPQLKTQQNKIFGTLFRGWKNILRLSYLYHVFPCNGS